MRGGRSYSAGQPAPLATQLFASDRNRLGVTASPAYVLDDHKIILASQQCSNPVLKCATLASGSSFLTQFSSSFLKLMPQLSCKIFSALSDCVGRFSAAALLLLLAVGLSAPIAHFPVVLKKAK